MKKHDFESTFKKNAKEQTPEMAEREHSYITALSGTFQNFDMFTLSTSDNRCKEL